MTTAPQIRSQSFLGTFAVASGLNAAENGLAVGWALPDVDGLQRAALLPIPTWPSKPQVAPLELDQPLLIGSELSPNLPLITGITAQALDLAGTALSFDSLSGQPTVVLQVSDATDPDVLSHIPSSILLFLTDVEGIWPLSSGSSDTDALGYPWAFPEEPITAIQYLPATAAGSISIVQPLMVQSVVPAEGAVHNAYVIDPASDQLIHAWPRYQRTAGSDSESGPPDPASLSGEAVLIPSPAVGEPAVVMASMATQSTYGGLTPKGDQDILITGYTSEGALVGEGDQVWAQLLGNAVGSAESPSPAPFPQLAFDPISRQLLVAGTLKGSLGTINPAFSTDVGIALASYGLDGSLLWERRIGDVGAGQQTIADLAVAPDGTVLVLGTTISLDGRGLYGQSPKGNGADLDSFITAYSTAGERLWTHQFGSANNDMAKSMAFMPVADGDEQRNTLVVVGEQESNAGESQAWVELLEVPDLVDVEATALPPAALNLDWSAAGIDGTSQLPRVMLQEVVNPDGSREHYFTLSGQVDADAGIPQVQVGVEASSADRTVLFSEPPRLAPVDPLTGEWSLTIRLEGLSDLDPAYLGAVFVEPVVPDGAPDSFLLPDAVKELMLLLVSGTGLPGDYPQRLPLDPDGDSGPEQPVLLQRRVLRDGAGALTYEGQRLLVDYSGTLLDGTPFDSSLNPGRLPFELTLGEGGVITGWDQGLQGLPMDSQVQLVIPPELAYGSRETSTIPANSTLVFEVDLRADLSSPEVFLASEQIQYFRSIDQWWQAFEYWKLFVSADDQEYLRQLQSEREQALYPYLVPSLVPNPVDWALSSGIDDGTIDNDDISVVLDPQTVLQVESSLDYAENVFQVDNFLNYLTIPADFIPPSGLSLPEFNVGSEVNETLLARHLPQLAMGGLGDDKLQSLSQAALLYGESGDDQISAIASDFSVLDGGAGDDLLILGFGNALVNGGSGFDVMLTPPVEVGTQWLPSNPAENFTIGTTSYEVFRRQSIETADILQTIYVSGVEDWYRTLNSLDLSAAEYRASDLLHALQSTPVPLELAADNSVIVGTHVELSNLLLSDSDGIQLLSESLEVRLTDVDLAADALSDFISSHNFAVETASLQILSGSYAELLDFAASHQDDLLNFPSTVTLRLTDSGLNASDLLRLQATSGLQLDASSIQLLAGSAAERQTIFSNSNIEIPPSGRWQSLPAADSIQVGEWLEFILAFDQPMQLQPSAPLPSLKLTDAVSAEFDLEASSLQDGVLVFRHQVSVDHPLKEFTIADDALLLSSPSDLVNSSGQSAASIQSHSFLDQDSLVAPDVSASVLGRVYSPGDVIQFNLKFADPVRWRSDSDSASSPSLLLSDGLVAQAVESSDSEFSSTQQFHLSVADHSQRVDALQINQLLGNGCFVDEAGHCFLPPEQDQLSVRNAPVISPLSWNLDLDGDGSQTIYTDGILLIRYLINRDYSPEQLTAGLAIDHSNRSPSEIVNYLSSGFDEGFLDVDRSGETSLYEDGIVLLRHLMGLKGANLIQGGVVSSRSGLLPLDTGLQPVAPTALGAPAFEALANDIGAVVGSLQV